MPDEPTKPDDEAQSKRFIEKAKELGVEVDAETFGKLIGQIAPVKAPQPSDDRPQKNGPADR